MLTEIFCSIWIPYLHSEFLSYMISIEMDWTLEIIQIFLNVMYYKVQQTQVTQFTNGVQMSNDPYMSTWIIHTYKSNVY